MFVLTKMPKVGDIIKHKLSGATHLVLDTHDIIRVDGMKTGEVTVLTLKNDRTKNPRGGIGRMFILFNNWYLVASVD